MASWNTSIALNNIQNEINQINYIIDNNVDGIGPQGLPGTNGTNGVNGTSSFTTTLHGGATYYNNTTSSVQFPNLGLPSAAGYCITNQKYNGCFVGCTTSTNQNVSYIGITTTIPSNPANPKSDIDWELYIGTNNTIQLESFGSLTGDIYNYTGSIHNFAISYTGTIINFYMDDIIIFTKSVPANQSFYGYWGTYNEMSSNILNNLSYASYLQGATGATGATGANGVKGDPGSITSPVNNLVEFMAGVNITGGLNMGSANSSVINCRAITATYELNAIPPPTGSISLLQLGANNNTSYQLIHNNPVGATTNQLALQYYSANPTKTLMTVLPTGDMQFGDNTSANPNVYVQGTVMVDTIPTLTLGRVYDSYYNKPTGMGAIGNTIYQNIHGYSLVPNVINSLASFSTTSLLSSCTEITVDFTTLTINGTNTGVNTSPYSLLIYLGSSTTEVYNMTTCTSFYIQSPGVAANTSYNFNSNSTIQLKYYSKSVDVPIVYVLATIITGVVAAELTITNFSYSALIKVADSGFSTVVSA